MSNTASKYQTITCITRIRFPRPWNWSLTVIPFGVVVRRALRPGRQCAGSWKRSESRDGKWPDHLLGRSMEHQESHTQTITKQQSFLRRYVPSWLIENHIFPNAPRTTNTRKNPFSGLRFTARPHGVIRFVASASFKKKPIEIEASDCLMKNISQPAMRRFLKSGADEWQ